MSKKQVKHYRERSGKTYALIYCRVSSERQANEGHGLDAQESRCRQYAKQKGYEVVEVFKDSISGGGDFMKRPAMRDVLSYVEKNAYKNYVLIFDDLKRFARDVAKHWELRHLFQKLGIELESPNFEFKNDSEEGWLNETVNAVFNEYDRRTNRRQVIQKMKARLESGYWTFGSKKGYTLTKNSEHGKIAMPNEEGEVLRQALEGFANGMFIRKIDVCKFLVEKGFWKKQSPEKYIDKFTELIKDSFYAGFIEYSAWEVSRRLGKHKGIITLETFELNQKRLGNLDLGKRIRTDITDDFPIRGLQNCADCEHHITATWIKGRNKRHPYYYCQNKNCPSYWKVIPKEIIESQFIKLLKKTALKKDVSKIVKVVFDKVWTDEIQNITKSQNDLKLKKVDLEKKIVELTNLVISAKTESMKRAYESQIEPLSEELELVSSSTPVTEIDLNIPYRTALNKATGLLKSPYDIWVSLDTREQQSLFYFVFEKKLLYSRNDGYRTAQIPSAIRLFEEFATSNTQDVEMGEIESPCRRVVL